MSLSLVFVIVSFILSLGVAAFLRALSPKQRLAPGPKGHWLSGNAAQFPPEKPWLWYAELHKKYGDIVRLTVPGSEMIILKTLDCVQDLFVKRSSIYSDRARQVMTGEVVGLNISTFIAPYGEFWRAQRKLWHHHLGPTAVPSYHPMLYRTNLELIKSLHEGRDNVNEALHQSIVRIMLLVAYGMDIKKDAQEWPAKLSHFNNEVLATMAPGKYYVEMIPLLKYIPSWFPGAEWKRYGLHLKAKSTEIADEPFQRVKRSLASGNVPDSVTAQMLEETYPGIAGTEECQKWVTGSIYGAGVDTTQAILRRFLFAMVTNPEVQKRARAEIDLLTEGRRLPTLDDVAFLPYLTAIMKECFRWQASLPTAVPHRLMQDDIYNGLFIRKGSIIIPNFWAVTHDPIEYPEPDTFNPDRFLGAKPALDPRTYLFGVGRRVCPGRDFAEASIFSTMSLLLATSVLRKASDGAGQEIEPQFVTTGSFGNDLAPFPCQLEPRSTDHVQLLNTVLDSSMQTL